MKIVADTHTHTIASGHAYNTVLEMAKAASEVELELLAITDHGPSVHGVNSNSYFNNIDIIPDELYGVRILKGCEVNILDYNGKIDLEERTLKKLDFVIASLHAIIIQPGSVEENTNAVLGALKNPYIDAIGHPDDIRYPIDYEKVIKFAKDNNKLIEMNEGSFRVRKGGEKVALLIAKLAKKYETKLCVGSDAHFITYLGKYEKIDEILEKADVPEELVVNTSKERLLQYLRQRGKNI